MFEFGNSFYERIENVLNLQKISKVKFYTDLNISKTTVLNWKKRNLPSLEVMLNLSEYLDVSINWLLTGIDTQASQNSNSPAQIVKRIENKLEELTNIKQHDENNNYEFYSPLHDCIKSYELTKWFYGIQIPTIEKLERIATNLHISLQYLITGSNVPPEEYDKYLNAEKSESEKLHKIYNCLTDENKKIVNKVCYSLLLNQTSQFKRQAEYNKINVETI